MTSTRLTNNIVMADQLIMQNILSAGYPTNEERLIFGLGLGGSGQSYDPSVITTPFQWGRRRTKIKVPVSPYGAGTRCPHIQSAREVCQLLSGMISNLSACHAVCILRYTMYKVLLQSGNGRSESSTL